MKSKSITAICFGISQILFISNCYANQIRELKLEEKVDKSDLVVIGTVTEIGLDVKYGAYSNKYALVLISSVLKGDPEKTIKVEYKGEISELNPLCCIIGNSYLFFLRRVPSYVYISTNGPYGIYEIQKQRHIDKE